jgi:SEC-C motif domain protein
MKVNSCPCKSSRPYGECCRRFHEGGARPATALELMRSRYSAYALCLVDYIMNTTHPDNPGRKSNKAAWRKELLRFARQTRFDNLEILEFKDDPELATVTFKASMRQQNTDLSFTEKSTFAKVDGKWLYKSGEMPTPRGLLPASPSSCRNLDFGSFS